jgi:hypothetical protein
VVASSPKEYPSIREGEGSDILVTFLYLNLFSVFSVVNF